MGASDLVPGSTSSLEEFGEVAGRIAREIGGPLTAIEMAVHRLQRDRPEGNGSPELETILSQSHHLAVLARTLLALARPIHPTPRALDVNEAVEVAVGLARTEMDAKGILMELQLDPTLPHAHADPHQLREALLALLMNARLALGEWTGARWIRVRTDTDPSGKVRVRLQDSGPGVPPGSEEKIFLPFVSGWGRQGVGLSLSRLSVLRQGGELRVETQEDDQSVFVLLLEATWAGIAGTDRE